MIKAKMELPLPVREHGTEMVMVKVGRHEKCQEFSVHKRLITTVSLYFKGALNPGFQTTAKDTVILEHQCPLAFAVLFNYVYTGIVYQDASFFTQSSVQDDVLWLRTLKLAHITLIHPLLLISDLRIRRLFGDDVNKVPSTAFVDELYDETPQEDLQKYIVAHTCYWIINDPAKDWKEWKALFERQPEFGVAVAVRLAKTQSMQYKGHKNHTFNDPALNADVIFPEPRAEVKMEAGKEQENVDNGLLQDPTE